MSEIEDQKWTATLGWSSVRKLTVISEREGGSVSNMLAKAIVVYAMLSDRVASGTKVVLVDADETETEITVTWKKEAT